MKNCLYLLREMVAIPSESQNESALAQFLEQYLRKELNMETQVQHISGNSCNVIGRWKSSSSQNRRLILGGHIDTVPPTSAWKTDPYKLVECGNELHGLGAADMKGGLAAQLTVLKQLKDEKCSFGTDIEFVGLADEERHSAGAHTYVRTAKEHNTLYRDNFFVMAEPHYDNIVIGATGKVLLSLHVQGAEGHAATPEKGLNAIDCMVSLLKAMQDEYFQKYVKGKCASYCCLKIDGGYQEYSLSIPVECSCLLNKQLSYGEQIDTFIEQIHMLYEKKVGRGVLTIQPEIPNYSAYQLDPEQKNLNRLLSFLKEQFGHQPELRINQSVSDGNIFYHSLGIPTVLFGPRGISFHTENEYVEKSSLSSYMDELYAYIKQEYTH